MPGTARQEGQVGGFRLLTLTADGDYQVGGYPLRCGPMGVVIPLGVSVGGDYLGVWDMSAQKLRVVHTNTANECAAHDDLTGVTLRVLVG